MISRKSWNSLLDARNQLGADIATGHRLISNFWLKLAVYNANIVEKLKISNTQKHLNKLIMGTIFQYNLNLTAEITICIKQPKGKEWITGNI